MKTLKISLDLYFYKLWGNAVLNGMQTPMYFLIIWYMHEIILFGEKKKKHVSQTN